MQDLRFDEIEGLLDGGGDRQARSVGQGRGIRAEEGRRGCRWHHHLGAFVWGIEAAGGERGGQETAGSGVGARADEPEACGRPGLGQRVRQGRHRRARHRDLVAVGVVFAVEGGRVRAGIPVDGVWGRVEAVPLAGGSGCGGAWCSPAQPAADLRDHGRHRGRVEAQSGGLPATRTSAELPAGNANGAR
ncbi:hypothetical protein KBX53_06810 [Micromonospora sp. M51]|uniref:hypothetical protein n=1 Tax=Micromonospora sp. M51 TaxID=2824889 RepID=UPI001B3979B4|nr:hypothetical protein [Micromonospora sp. M51]MBQ1010659.1 hypothetical protein [Micromonospora sp. M51]